MKYYKDYSSNIKGKAKKMNKMPANDVARIQKDKIGGKKLQKAMREYNDWHQKFTEIRKNKNCHLSHDVKWFCRQLDNSNKEIKKLEDYGKDSLDLGKLSVLV